MIVLQAPPQHLLAASVMSAPAVIAVAKMNHPETHKSATNEVEHLRLEKGDETSGFEALANGAAVAGKTVAAILTNYIAIISLLAFINDGLGWFGARVGHPQLSFEVICSYIFWPVAWLIGIEAGDCQEVGRIIGLKVFATEILAFQELGGSHFDGIISDKSWAITTYALSGFSSLTTIAMSVGVWHVICPSKTSSMARQLWRVLINANITCFITAAIAGLLLTDDISVDNGVTLPPLWQRVRDLPGYKELVEAI